MNPWLTAVTLVFAGGIFLHSVEARDVARGDYTKRETRMSERRFPMTERTFEVNERITSQRFTVNEWQGKFSPLGQRRSSINDVGARSMDTVDNRTLDFDTRDFSLARQNDRRAYHRNLDEVRETELAPGYREPRIVDVPLGAGGFSSGREISMRDINRMVYQRNHSDEGGISVQEAGSEE